jgi:hypothetical protein
VIHRADSSSGWLLQQNPQFGRPVRQGQAQTLQVWVARPDLRFDACDLAAATVDSGGDVLPFTRHLLERLVGSIEHRLLARKLQVPAQDHIRVPGIKFQ